MYLRLRINSEQAEHCSNDDMKENLVACYKGQNLVISFSRLQSFSAAWSRGSVTVLYYGKWFPGHFSSLQLGTSHAQCIVFYLSKHWSIFFTLFIKANTLVLASDLHLTQLTFWCYVFHLRRRLHKLGVSKITQVDFLPREVVSYSKETQTPLATHQSEGKIVITFFKKKTFS